MTARSNLLVTAHGAPVHLPQVCHRIQTEITGPPIALRGHYNHTDGKGPRDHLRQCRATSTWSVESALLDRASGSRYDATVCRALIVQRPA